MRNILRFKLIRSTVIYTFFGTISSIIPMVLLPILTKWLTPKEYLYVDIFNVVFQISIAIVGLNVYSAIPRFYIEKESLNFPQFINTNVMFIFGTTFVLLCISPFLSFFVSESLHMDISIVFIVVVLVYTMLYQLSEIKFSLLVMQDKAVQFGLYRTVKTILELFFSIVLVVVFSLSWEGRIAGQFVGVFLIAIIMTYQLFREYRWRFNFSYTYIKEALSYSFPLVFHIISTFALGYVNRFFIISMVGETEAGLYSVAYQIGLCIAMLQTAFNNAWLPYFFNEIQNRARIVKITYGVFFVLVVVVIALQLFLDLIFTYCIGDAFSEAKYFVTWLALGYVFNGMYKMASAYFFYLKKTRMLAVITVLTGLMAIVLNYVFIYIWGVMGAAIATCLSFLFQFLLVWYFSNRIYPMPWFSCCTRKRSL